MWSRLSRKMVRRSNQQNQHPSTKLNKSPISPKPIETASSKSFVGTKSLISSLANGFVASSKISQISHHSFKSSPSILEIKNMIQTAISSSNKSATGLWNKSWSKYKFSSPPSARETHFEAIRQAILKKYGAKANALIVALLAVATDALFWWIAELLLDDGM